MRYAGAAVRERVRNRLRSWSTAAGALPWRLLARRAALSAALLAGWLALSWTLRAWLGAWEDGGGGLGGKIMRFYLRNWASWTWLGALWCAAWWGVKPLWRALQEPRFFDRAVGAATPGALGAIRAWVCAILLIMTLREDLMSVALLPRVMVRQQGLMAILHLLPIGFDAFLANAAALRAFQYLTAALLALGVVGLGTRAVVPAAAVCYFVLGGIVREHSFYYHSGIVPLYALAVLSFTRCGQGWSLDRLWRAARGKAPAAADRPGAYFGWARYAVWTVIALPYAAAGCSKLYYMGLRWVSADSVRWMLLRPTLDPRPFDFDLALRIMPLPDALFVLLGIVALGTELAFGLVLVSRRARALLPAATVGIHVGILFLQNILFLDLMLLLWVFYDWSPLARLGRRLAGRSGAADGPEPVADAAPVAEAAPEEEEPRARPAAGRLAAARPGAAHRRGAAAALAIMLFLASWWVTKIEWYPLTAMQMFTAHGRGEAGVVSYVAAIAHYEDGSRGPAPFGEWIGAMPPGRTRPVLRRTLQDPAGRAVGQQLLDAMIRAANAAGAGPRVTSVELQRRRWNFRADPDDPGRGVLTHRYVHPAPAAERGDGAR